MSSSDKSPLWAKVGQTYISVKAFLDALVLAIQESRKFIDKSRTKQRERPKGCIIYSPHCLRMPKTFVGREGILYTYIGVGAFSVVHWKTIFLICYLLDYQQVQENSNVSIILLGDKKEPTKWKTNLVQQILLPNNHFPCYFYFKNHFYWRKEKRCVTCLWLPTKANTQI